MQAWWKLGNNQAKGLGVPYLKFGTLQMVEKGQIFFKNSLDVKLR